MHSYFKCGVSQKFCRTGKSAREKCQWSNTIVPMLIEMLHTEEGRRILRAQGYVIDEADEVDEKGYVAWLGRRHPRRVLQEVVSNGFATIIGFIIQRDQPTFCSGSPVRSSSDGGLDEVITPSDVPTRMVSDASQDSGFADDTESPRAMVNGMDGSDRGASSFVEVLRRWESGCIVCRTKGRPVEEHEWLRCRVDVDDTAAVYKGVQLLQALQAPQGANGGRCWMVGELCGCRWPANGHRCR